MQRGPKGGGGRNVEGGEGSSGWSCGKGGVCGGVSEGLKGGLCRGVPKGSGGGRGGGGWGQRSRPITVRFSSRWAEGQKWAQPPSSPPPQAAKVQRSQGGPSLKVEGGWGGGGSRPRGAPSPFPQPPPPPSNPAGFIRDISGISAFLPRCPRCSPSGDGGAGWGGGRGGWGGGWGGLVTPLPLFVAINALRGHEGDAKGTRRGG